MATGSLRDSDYAKELTQPASFTFPDGSVGRIEYLLFKTGAAKGKEGYRFSWWKDGRMVPRPLDFTEAEYLELFKSAVDAGIFSNDAVARMRKILDTK
jgi:hypothetical protein